MSWSSRSSRRTNIHLVNRQRHDAVPLGWLARVARCAVRQLRIRRRGALVVTFIKAGTMARLNRRFMHHRGLTDVLTFRYPNEPVAGDILISPAFARRYAEEHGLSYRQELARDLVHGLLHWTGREDKTPARQRRMRALEDKLLSQCGAANGNPHG